MIWAGDFNQSLDGSNLVGSKVGRDLLGEALDHLGFDAWNRSQDHAKQGLLAIDLICGPRDLAVRSVERIDPCPHGEWLSDHAGYVVELS
jgi:endonuclease/exonuclease/phosphatase family metal-dependent hydrolase